MDGLPKVIDYDNAKEFLEQFDVYLDCFFVSKNITDQDKKEDIQLKFLKFSLSKSPAYGALSIDGRTTYATLKAKVSSIFPTANTPFQDFWNLSIRDFANAYAYAVKSKKLLSQFLSDEKQTEVLIQQRLCEILPADAALQLEKCKDFSDFLNKVSLMWSMLSVQQETRICAHKSDSLSTPRRLPSQCYNCAKFYHISRRCRLPKAYCGKCKRSGHLSRFCHLLSNKINVIGNEVNIPNDDTIESKNE